MMHEASLHDENAMYTLTYETAPDFGVEKLDVQLWLKRYRKAIYPAKIRYFACGEYGKKRFRPHYHVIIFGRGSQDLNLVTNTWGLGRVEYTPVTFASARYCAKYVCKLFKGRNMYEEAGIMPEFALMSRRPGIGNRCAMLHLETWSNRGFIFNGKRRQAIPRYYVNLLSEERKAMHVEKGRIRAEMYRKKFHERNVSAFKESVKQIHKDVKDQIERNLTPPTDTGKL